ncbi:hypothetical protein HanRHA438_Chr17g0800611 [Helianthus annuus]|nr:hypothetical protein HanHA89_Chr17g0695901 [Helianthus annuus]KAJ0825210.1 hypothetical protein HanRHA438_Chr17g0800611 [Helianthus annuus]
MVSIVGVAGGIEKEKGLRWLMVSPKGLRERGVAMVRWWWWALVAGCKGWVVVVAG